MNVEEIIDHLRTSLLHWRVFETERGLDDWEQGYITCLQDLLIEYSDNGQI